MGAINEYLGTMDDVTVVEGKKLKPGVLMSVKGVFQAEDAKNKNNRVYPTETWDSVFNDKDWSERLTSRGILGEVDHPNDGGALRRTSHIVTKLERKKVSGKKVIFGEADILDTPDGRVVATLFKAGAKVGISSRGEGTVKHDDKEGVDRVQKDYRPEGFDFVTQPSTIGAFPEAHITESEIKQNHSLVLNAMKNLIEDTSDKRTLLSVYKTLEGYKDVGGKELLESLETKLTEEKPVTPPTPEIKPDKQDPEEEKMGDKLNQEAFEELRSMARELSAQEIAKIKAESEEKEKDLRQQIVDMTARHEETQKRLDAAERVIDDLDGKVNDKNSKLVDPEKYEDVKKRLEAAKQIIEAFIDKTKELKNFEKYAKAGEEVVQALLDRTVEHEVKSYVDDKTADLSEEQKKKVHGLMKDCESLSEAKRQLRNVLGLIGKVPPRRKADGGVVGLDENDEGTPNKPATSFGGKLRERANRV